MAKLQSETRAPRAAGLVRNRLVGSPAVRLRNRIVKLLTDAGYQIAAHRRMPNDLGWQLRWVTGQVVSIYDTGSLMVQGKAPDAINRLLSLTSANPRQVHAKSGPARNNPNPALPNREGFMRRRKIVRGHIARLGFEVIREECIEDELGTRTYEFRLVPGVIVQVPDAGWLEIGLTYPHFLLDPDFARYRRLRRLLAPLLPPRERRAPRPAKLKLPQQCVDANGCPIRLPGTDAVLAMCPPPPPPKVYENPKTLRHMENRLRALGYSIRSEKWVGRDWRIKLATGQTIYYREGGSVSLAPSQRDYRLERLFNIVR